MFFKTNIHSNLSTYEDLTARFHNFFNQIIECYFCSGYSAFFNFLFNQFPSLISVFTLILYMFLCCVVYFVLFVFILCLVFCFVCLRFVSCVPNVASFSGLSIFDFLHIIYDRFILYYKDYLIYFKFSIEKEVKEKY